MEKDVAMPLPQEGFVDFFLAWTKEIPNPKATQNDDISGGWGGSFFLRNIIGAVDGKKILHQNFKNVSLRQGSHTTAVQGRQAAHSYRHTVQGHQAVHHSRHAVQGHRHRQAVHDRRNRTRSLSLY